MGKKFQLSMNLMPPGMATLRSLAPLTICEGNNRLSVQFLEQQVAVVPLEFMRDHHERAASRVRHSQVPHPGQEVLHGRKLVALIV